MAAMEEEETTDVANLVVVAVSLSPLCPISAAARCGPIGSTRFLAALPLPPNSVDLVLAPATIRSIGEREREEERGACRRVSGADNGEKESGTGCGG